VSGADDAAERLVKDPPPGCLLYLALAERGAGPLGQDLQYLSLRALCMDREVPVVLAEQAGLARYAAVDTVPITAIDCLAGPSEPVDYAVDGFRPWLVLSHLNVNHLSLADTPGQDGPMALRSMIELYAPEDAQAGKSHFLHQLARAIVGVQVEQVTRRLPNRGALAFARGAQVQLTLTERGLGGASPFLLGAVLEHYFASHVSINSFVELSMHMRHWSQPLRWNRQPGDRPTL
jgi:type VI secretion system protein ImpG